MTNEDAIKLLNNLKNDIGNPHYERLWHYAQAIDEICYLLEDQEAVEPIPYHRSDGTIFKYECRKCRTKIFKNDLFCRRCGKAVKWE